jgi:hypothetical protein
MTKKYSKYKPDIQSSLMLTGNVDDKNALAFLLKTFIIAIVINLHFLIAGIQQISISKHTILFQSSSQ